MAASSSRKGALELLRRFVADRGDDELARELADRAVRSLPPVEGLRVLDVGSGPGYYAAAMRRRGADVAAVELSPAELAGDEARGSIVADARHLPHAEATFEAVVCSNMLEHTPDPLSVIDEIARVLRPGGWAYLSWTNWLSPWGGHAIAPLHYLGPERGLRTYRRLFGEPTGPNLPYDGVWPLHISTVVDHVEGHPALDLERMEPRYYPWARAVMRVPGVREVLAWNCVLWVRRTEATTAAVPGPAGHGRRS